MKKTIDFDYNNEKNIMVATLKTSIGTFVGKAKMHPDDPCTPSQITGGRIAEARAYLSFYKEQAKRKKLELKGLKRLLNSIPKNEGYKYAQSMYNAIENEYYHLIDMITLQKAAIYNTIEARKLYIKSRTEDKQTTEEMLKKLEEGLKQLENINKDKVD